MTQEQKDTAAKYKKVFDLVRKDPVFVKELTRMLYEELVKCGHIAKEIEERKKSS